MCMLILQYAVYKLNAISAAALHEFTLMLNHYATTYIKQYCNENYYYSAFLELLL